MYKQRITPPLFVSLCLILFASCSKKPEDFVGVHTFYQGIKYVVIDSTTNISKGYSKKYKEIQTLRYLPLKIDIFKNGEQVSGTAAIETIQQNIKGYYFDKSLSIKKDLTNFHLLGDTLMFELKYENALIGGQTIDFKLIKNGNEVLLIEDQLASDSIDLSCNKFIKSKNGKNIFYISSVGSQVDLVKESNRCADESALKAVASEYPTEKIPYLKELLSKH